MMQPDFHPTRAPLVILGCGAPVMLVGLVAGAPVALLQPIASGLLLLLATALVVDRALSGAGWEDSPLLLQRRMPAAMAIGARCSVNLQLQNTGTRSWQVVV